MQALGGGLAFRTAFEGEPAADATQEEYSSPGFPGPLLNLFYRVCLTPSLSFKVGVDFGRSSEGAVYRRTDEWSCDYFGDEDFDGRPHRIEKICGFGGTLQRDDSRLVLSGNLSLHPVFFQRGPVSWSLGPRLDIGGYFPAIDNPGSAFVGLSGATEILMGVENFRTGLEVYGGGLYEFGSGLRPVLGAQWVFEVRW
ncbi:MAG: hypothetical protein HY696_05130 [Deltaproteobacteria bacterium]|nr:hypothetical protein [Deltaproteobacteria bacterium]